MKNIIGLLMVFLSTQAFAASGSGNISNVLTLGGVNATDGLNISEPNAQGYFTIYSSNNGGATLNNFYQFFKEGVSGQYQVTSGKTFKAVRICVMGAAANMFMQLASSTASFTQGAASLTSPIYQGGATMSYPMFSHPTAYVWQCFGSTYAFTSTTYPASQIGTANYFAIHILGKEITP